MQRPIRYLPILLTLVFTFYSLNPHCADAAGGSSDQLATDIDKALRSAEKSIFSGNFQEGAAIMNEVAVKLDELKAVDPENKKLLTISSKFNQLQKKVGQNIGVAAPDKGQSSLHQAKGQSDSQEQNRLIEQWRKTFMAYTTPREEKYLGQHPELLDEAKNVLGEYEKAVFPLGRPVELQSYAASFKKAIDHATAEKGTTGIDDQWLPRIKPLLAPNDPAYINPSGPSLQQGEEVKRMDGNFTVGKQILDDYGKQFPGGQSTHFLGQAIDDLRRAVDGYEKGRKSAVDRQLAELRGKLDRSLGLLARNKDWTATSGNPIQIINKGDMTEITALLDSLKQIPGVPADTLAGFDQEVAKLRSQDNEWREKKTAQDNAPKPFPAAGMTSLSLLAEMEKILKDRGIGPVEKLVIVDKDWWVQQGEFRYIKAAALQKDNEGPYFTHVTFKQMLTLSGYGPTELWEQGKKTRVTQ